MRIVYSCLIVWLSCSLSAQTLAEKLGYTNTDKLLIIHADDLGITHSTNQASFRALERGSVNSASIMAPTPWLPEVADYVTENGPQDFGMHLTLTSEWQWLKWRPVASRNEVPTLINEHGYFHADCQTLAEHGDPMEVKRELRAQIEHARGLGIEPTHLDTHMGCLVFGRPEYFGTYLELAREYRMPALVSKAELGAFPKLAPYVEESDPLVDRIITAGVADFENGMDAFYERTLRELPPGITVLLVHCAYDDRESRGMAHEHPNWGNEWRQQDTDFFVSQKCLQLLHDNDIQLITWRQIQETMK